MFSKEARLGLRTWIEIDKLAIAHNYRIFRSLIPKTTKLMAVVKSNAYGHGLVDFSKEIAALGADWLAVDSIVEGLRLRKEGIETPMLVLGYTLPERIQEAVDNNISITISNSFTAQGLKDLKLNGKVKVHIKIDSGMHRQGFMVQEMKGIITFLKEHQGDIEVEGLYTHFASAKDPNETEPTQKQIQVFKKWITAFKDAGFNPITHAAASGATLIFPETHFDMVRVGIAMHGIWPSVEAQTHMEKKYPLKPTLTWKTIISEIKTLPKDEKVGYDFTEEVKRETVIGICPIGYWHGFPRSLSSIGITLVNGGKAKVIGRVSMDMIVIDITDVKDPKIGDEVVLIGQSENEYVGVADMAKLADYSSYELVTRINPLIKKFYY
ncbi:alanine racemase [Candidatus Parcubacteria bacterium]|nr:alanine racemase [Candidatus Parcubacteria bacterium]